MRAWYPVPGFGVSLQRSSGWCQQAPQAGWVLGAVWVLPSWLPDEPYLQHPNGMRGLFACFPQVTLLPAPSPGTFLTEWAQGHRGLLPQPSVLCFSTQPRGCPLPRSCRWPSGWLWGCLPHSEVAAAAGGWLGTRFGGPVRALSGAGQESGAVQQMALLFSL